ncbi:uncharacterized protein LOC102808283 [Saccoglossus kowalevskii]|uniref:Leucine-rich repeat-containing protein DDB_G0290503-like n=1 Tax=Saccoglossus kowalevskii TaxID=10224 RepID=A0ABM0LW00_SACKO|nr:PREDICTED: putative leucine-rich repeat-containing protein DDB_G0290503-like [Saccoglossus kowalevskii]
MLQEEEMKREIEDSQQKLKESVNINTQLSQDRASLEEKVNNLQVRMSQLISDTDIKDSLIMGLEKQTENHKEEIKLERQKSLKYEEDSTLLKEQLEICEHTMTNNLKSLSEKYQSMEETLATVENDYRKKIDLLNSELHSNQKTSFQLTNECETLRRNNINLLDQLNYEKDKKDYLQSDLSKFKEESNRIEASLKEQLKQALGSLQSSHKKREVQQQSIGDLESTCADQSLQILHLQNELKL